MTDLHLAQMKNLIDVSSSDSIPPELKGGPVGFLLEYHNLHRPLDEYEEAQLLIGMCIDHRLQLRMPERFAYIIRNGGANLRNSEFEISYAIAVGGVRAMALIGHTDCGMVNLMARRKPFVQGLVEQVGWAREWAEAHFKQLAPMSEIGDEVDFVVSEARRLRLRYSKIPVTPLLHRVEDNRLYMIRDS